jgi:hypothetical protein
MPFAFMNEAFALLFEERFLGTVLSGGKWLCEHLGAISIHELRLGKTPPI